MTKTTCSQLALIGLKVPNFFSQAFFFSKSLHQILRVQFHLKWIVRKLREKKISDNDDVLIEQRRLNKKTVTNYCVCSYTWAIHRGDGYSFIWPFGNFRSIIETPISISFVSIACTHFAHHFENDLQCNTLRMKVDFYAEMNTECKKKKKKFICNYKQTYRFLLPVRNGMERRCHFNEDEKRVRIA